LVSVPSGFTSTSRFFLLSALVGIRRFIECGGSLGHDFDHAELSTTNFLFDRRLGGSGDRVDRGFFLHHHQGAFGVDVEIPMLSVHHGFHFILSYAMLRLLADVLDLGVLGLVLYGLLDGWGQVLQREALLGGSCACRECSDGKEGGECSGHVVSWIDNIVST
jgi:hypothetical protein